MFNIMDRVSLRQNGQIAAVQVGRHWLPVDAFVVVPDSAGNERASVYVQPSLNGIPLSPRTLDLLRTPIRALMKRYRRKLEV